MVYSNKETVEGIGMCLLQRWREQSGTKLSKERQRMKRKKRSDGVNGVH